jgi:hypothetical protein
MKLVVLDSGLRPLATAPRPLDFRTFNIGIYILLFEYLLLLATQAA